MTLRRSLLLLSQGTASGSTTRPVAGLSSTPSLLTTWLLPIFLDDEGGDDFLERFAADLDRTKTSCYVWALLPNHFHVLSRTQKAHGLFPRDWLLSEGIKMVEEEL